MDQPTNYGDEFDDSYTETETETDVSSGSSQDSLSEIGTNSPPSKNSGAKIKHAGGKLVKK